MSAEQLQVAFDRRCTKALRAALVGGASPTDRVVLASNRGFQKEFPAWLAAVVVAWHEAVPHLRPPDGWCDAEHDPFYWVTHGDWPTYQALLAHTPPTFKQLILSSALWAAVGADAYDAAKRLLEAGAPADGHPGHKPQLSRAESVDIARLLITHGADPNGKETTRLENLPVVLAAGVSDDLLRYLLTSGARLDEETGRAAARWASTSIREPIGQRPFCRARCMRLLESYGVDVGPYLDRALYMALDYSFPAKVDRDIAGLLELGACPKNMYLMRFLALRNMLTIHSGEYPLTRAWLAAHPEVSF